MEEESEGEVEVVFVVVIVDVLVLVTAMDGVTAIDGVAVLLVEVEEEDDPSPVTTTAEVEPLSAMVGASGSPLVLIGDPDALILPVVVCCC
jgi:hypothetical protein